MCRAYSPQFVSALTLAACFRVYLLEGESWTFLCLILLRRVLHLWWRCDATMGHQWWSTLQFTLVMWKLATSSAQTHSWLFIEVEGVLCSGVWLLRGTLFLHIYKFWIFLREKEKFVLRGNWTFLWSRPLTWSTLFIHPIVWVLGYTAELPFKQKGRATTEHTP